MDDTRILHGPPIPNEVKVGAGNTPVSELILKYAEENLDSLYMVSQKWNWKFISLSNGVYPNQAIQNSNSEKIKKIVRNRS